MAVSDLLSVSKSVKCLTCETPVDEIYFSNHLFFGTVYCLLCRSKASECYEFVFMRKCSKGINECNHNLYYKLDPAKYLAENFSPGDDICSHKINPECTTCIVRFYLNNLESLGKEIPWSKAIAWCRSYVDRTPCKCDEGQSAAPASSPVLVNTEPSIGTNPLVQMASVISTIGAQQTLSIGKSFSRDAQAKLFASVRIGEPQHQTTFQSSQPMLYNKTGSGEPQQQTTLSSLSILCNERGPGKLQQQTTLSSLPILCNERGPGEPQQQTTLSSLPILCNERGTGEPQQQTTLSSLPILCNERGPGKLQQQTRALYPQPILYNGTGYGGTQQITTLSSLPDKCNKICPGRLQQQMASSSRPILYNRTGPGIHQQQINTIQSSLHISYDRTRPGELQQQSVALLSQPILYDRTGPGKAHQQAITLFSQPALSTRTEPGNPQQPTIFLSSQPILYNRRGPAELQQQATTPSSQPIFNHGTCHGEPQQQTITLSSQPILRNETGPGEPQQQTATQSSLPILYNRTTPGEPVQQTTATLSSMPILCNRIVPREPQQQTAMSSLPILHTRTINEVSSNGIAVSSSFSVSRYVKCLTCKEFVKKEEFCNHLFFGPVYCHVCKVKILRCRSFVCQRKYCEVGIVKCKHDLKFIVYLLNYLTRHTSPGDALGFQSQYVSTKCSRCTVRFYLKNLESLNKKDPWDSAFAWCRSNNERVLCACDHESIITAQSSLPFSHNIPVQGGKSIDEIVVSSPPIKCFTCDVFIKEQEFCNHLFFGHVQCLLCKLKISDCQNFCSQREYYENRNVPCKHDLYFLANPATHLAGKFSLGDASGSQYVNAECTRCIVRYYVNNLKSLDKKTPWKRAIACCRSYVENVSCTCNDESTINTQSSLCSESVENNFQNSSESEITIVSASSLSKYSENADNFQSNSEIAVASVSSPSLSSGSVENNIQSTSEMTIVSTSSTSLSSGNVENNFQNSSESEITIASVSSLSQLSENTENNFQSSYEIIKAPLSSESLENNFPSSNETSVASVSSPSLPSESLELNFPSVNEISVASVSSSSLPSGSVENNFQSTSEITSGSLKNDFQSSNEIISQSVPSQVSACRYMKCLNCDGFIVNKYFHQHLVFGPVRCSFCFVKITSCYEFRSRHTYYKKRMIKCHHYFSFIEDPVDYLTENFSPGDIIDNHYVNANCSRCIVRFYLHNMEPMILEHFWKKAIACCKRYVKRTSCECDEEYINSVDLKYSFVIPAKSFYHVSMVPIENCPNCDRVLCSSKITVNTMNFLMSVVCECGLTIYITSSAPDLKIIVEDCDTENPMNNSVSNENENKIVPSRSVYSKYDEKCSITEVDNRNPENIPDSNKTTDECRVTENDTRNPMNSSGSKKKKRRIQNFHWRRKKRRRKHNIICKQEP